MKVPFKKMSAAANDFIFVEAGALPKTTEQRRKLVAHLCDRHRGIGADGLVALTRKAANAQWEFFNSDGSIAEMCGNAARSVAIYAHDEWGFERPFTLETLAGPVGLELLSEKQVRVTMPVSLVEPEVAHVHTEFGPIHGKFVNTSVPHFVIQVPDVQKYEHMTDIAVLVMADKQFGVDSTNVTFVKQGDALEAVTYERGVNDFTQACGTGAVAAALAMTPFKSWLLTPHVKVIMPGGVLVIGYDKEANQMTLTGEAYSAFDGEFSWQDESAPNSEISL